MAKKQRPKNKKVSRVSNIRCAVDNCDNPAYYIHSLLCHACYSADRKWGKRSVTDRVRRRKALAKYTERMLMLSERK